MNDTSAVEGAIKRLMDALNALDAAIELRLESDRGHGTLTEQVHAFSTDRARLAAELDGAQARSRDLQTTNREAARRLDDAMRAIRSVLAVNKR